MLSLFKNKTRTKVVTAEEIHAEIDKSEVSLKELLVDTGVTSNSHIIRKSKLATELGFTSIEVVDKANAILKKEEDIRFINEQSSKFNELVSLYKFEYPLDKILSRDQFKTIMDKYNLVSADISQYIKDVPEQVLLNIKNSKKAKQIHIVGDKYKILDISFEYYPWATEDKPLEKRIKNYISTLSYPYIPKKVYIPDIPSYVMGGRSSILLEGIVVNDYLSIKESELQVAAPKSHFNSSYINKLELNVTSSSVITDDPIAFQYLKGGFVRILDKWGTPDDQSYLDPMLTNEILN